MSQSQSFGLVAEVKTTCGGTEVSVSQTAADLLGFSPQQGNLEATQRIPTCIFQTGTFCQISKLLAKFDKADIGGMVLLAAHPPFHVLAWKP